MSDDSVPTAIDLSGQSIKLFAALAGLTELLTPIGDMITLATTVWNVGKLADMAAEWASLQIQIANASNLVLKQSSMKPLAIDDSAVGAPMQDLATGAATETSASDKNSTASNKKLLAEQVSETQHAATQIENISEKTAKAKTKDDKTWLSSFVDINMVAGKAGANLANGLAGTFEGFVEKAKAGTLTVGDAFKALGAAIGQALLNAIGESLIQMGVADLTKGTGDLIKGNYATGGKEMAVGAAESAGGGAIKGLAAAFLADGGLVTQPTLAMVGEAGSPEGVIPLSKLGNLGGTNLSVNNLSMSFPGVSSQSDLSGSNFKSSAARQFIQIQQYANRRTGKRNA